MTPNTDHKAPCPDDLLPWFVNHTLDPSQQRDVIAHLKHCRRCQQEVAWLKRVRQGIKATTEVSPGDLGLKRLLRRVGKAKQADQRHLRPKGWGWRSAVAIAASLVIVVQAGLLINQWFGPAAIKPLAGPSAEGPVLQITFLPTATEAQIRETVRAVGGSFAGGPSAIGVYQIRVNVPRTDRNAAQLMVDALRQKKDIVAHAAWE